MRHLYIIYLLLFPLGACVVDVPDFADENQTFRCESHSHCLESENYYCAGAENGQRGRCLKASPGNCAPGCGHPDNRCVFDPEAQESILESQNKVLSTLAVKRDFVFFWQKFLVCC